MRDCPACRVPLHGYEEVCPSCGTKQFPQRGGGGRVPYGASWKPDEPKVNVVPFVLVFVGVIAFLLISMQGTWIGQLMREGKHEPDPLEKMTYLDARTMIDTQLQQNLASVGAKNSKLTWHTPNSTAAGADERSLDTPIELTVDTSLPAADLRKQVVDPVKPYFEKAKLYTLTINDARLHAHWTYNLQPGTSPVSPDAGLDQE